MVLTVQVCQVINSFNFIVCGNIWTLHNTKWNISKTATKFCTDPERKSGSESFYCRVHLHTSNSRCNIKIENKFAYVYACIESYFKTWSLLVKYAADGKKLRFWSSCSAASCQRGAVWTEDDWSRSAVIFLAHFSVLVEYRSCRDDRLKSIIFIAVLMMCCILPLSLAVATVHDTVRRDVTRWLNCSRNCNLCWPFLMRELMFCLRSWMIMVSKNWKGSTDETGLTQDSRGGGDHKGQKVHAH